MKTYLVGGAVRDMVLGETPHDKDYVVFGATPEEMTARGFQSVGKDFPVFLHPQTKDEYALARKEIKTGNKHTDFKFIFGPDITPQEDMQRRDFTFNALMYDTDNNKIIDLVGGVEDIKNRTIRHINNKHFIEDPLRVLRMCRFAAKLNFEIAPETMKLSQDMVKMGMLNHLTSERIWKEIEKALNTEHFDKFILSMRECGALNVILPEIDKLWNVPENSKYHPEGNSGEHTILAIRQGYNLSPQIKFALLMHDVGKIDTPKNILPHHYGHEKKGEKHIDEICKRLRAPKKYRDFSKLVAKNHMKFHHIPQMSNSTFTDFLTDITNNFKNGKQMIDFLRACKCDSLGRKSTPAIDKNNEVFIAMKRCIDNFRIQRSIKASDMPNFDKLPPNHQISEQLRQFRIKHITQR